jgi:hypothetical protein
VYSITVADFPVSNYSACRYHLMMLFGGGEFLMEAMDISVIRDAVPDFDAAWLDFCRLFNASDAE